jgi:class 3 adenylate cyclase
MEAARRPVTVLFADLCGFTELSGSLDPEDVDRLLGRIFERLDLAVMEAGGFVDKHIGDAVMAVFGAPIAHGDYPRRALYAAKQMHAAMPVIAAEGRPRRNERGARESDPVAASQQQCQMAGLGLGCVKTVWQEVRLNWSALLGWNDGMVRCFSVECRPWTSLSDFERSGEGE